MLSAYLGLRLPSNLCVTHSIWESCKRRWNVMQEGSNAYTVCFILRKRNVFENKWRPVICYGFRLEGLISFFKPPEDVCWLLNLYPMLKIVRKGQIGKFKNPIIHQWYLHMTSQHKMWIMGHWPIMVIERILMMTLVGKSSCLITSA